MTSCQKLIELICPNECNALRPYVQKLIEKIKESTLIDQPVDDNNFDNFDKKEVEALAILKEF